MKVANIVLAGSMLALAGCATGRPYSSPSSPGSPGGGSSLTPVPDTTPSLGDPAGSGGKSFFRGNGPSLKMPEAFRDDVQPRSPRLSSRWQSPGSRPHTTQHGPGASSVSTNDRSSLLNEPTWSRFYRSTDRRAIETLLMGNGRRRVAVLGSLHGDETQSVALVEELARYLRVHPELLRSTTVLLVKTPNPDGLAGRTPYNVHGTDLNRNFPSPNWKDLNTVRSGDKPASEAETRVVMRLLGDFQPTLIVHLKDSRDKAVVNFEGNVQSQAEQVAKIVSGQVVQGLGEKTSGSLESYALNKLKCPSLTLLLAREASDQAAWAKNRDLFSAVLGAAGSSEQASPREDETHPFDQPSMRQSSMNGNRQGATVRGQSPGTSGTRRLGSSATLPDYQSAIPDHGYVELPPP